MADVEFDERAPSRPPLRREAGSLQGYVNAAGAITSVLLIIGVGVWGYRLTMRDVGGVPVIKALKGPMRISPEDPGGQIAQNEGLAVNAVAADEPLPEAPNRVVLAPKPLALGPNDIAPVDSAPVDSAGAAPEAAAAPAVTPDAAGGAAASAVTETSPDGAAGAAAGMNPVDAALASARNAELGQPDSSDAGGLAVASSPRPMLRPAGLAPDAGAPADATTTASAAAKPAEIDPAQLTPGTRLVQLGAYPDEAAARDAWARLRTRHEALLGDKSLVIQKAESGGRSFYRLRAAGFDGAGDARALCAALAAQDTACIPVTIR